MCWNSNNMMGIKAPGVCNLSSFRIQITASSATTTDLLYDSKVPFSQVARMNIDDNHQTVVFNETASMSKRSVDIKCTIFLLDRVGLLCTDSMSTAPPTFRLFTSERHDPFYPICFSCSPRLSQD